MELPYLFLKPFEKFKAEKIQFCAEQMLDAAPNSFTASLAGSILKNAGAEFVLIGSARERQAPKPVFSVKEKIAKTFEAGLQPILAFGESFEELEQDHSKEVLQRQMEEAASALSQDQKEGIWLLYEAPWVKRQTLDAALGAAFALRAVFRESAQEIFFS